jgi:hypothetical protein
MRIGFIVAAFEAVGVGACIIAMTSFVVVGSDLYCYSEYKGV